MCRFSQLFLISLNITLKIDKNSPDNKQHIFSAFCAFTIQIMKKLFHIKIFRKIIVRYLNCLNETLMSSQKYAFMKNSNFMELYTQCIDKNAPLKKIRKI